MHTLYLFLLATKLTSITKMHGATLIKVSTKMFTIYVTVLQFAVIVSSRLIKMHMKILPPNFLQLQLISRHCTEH
jgi:hypothetical protein